MTKGHSVGYVRVSTDDQNTARQLEGIELDKVFVDRASGKNAERSELQAALTYLREGDRLVVHSMDRLARSAEDLLRIVRELNERGVSVEFIKNGLTFPADQRNPTAHLMLTMLAGFAQFERELIRERQREGIELAKRRGAYKGRVPTVTPEIADQIRRRFAAGEPRAAIARDLKIGERTVYRYATTQAEKSVTLDSV